MEFDVIWETIKEDQALQLSLAVFILFLISFFGSIIRSFRRHGFCPCCGSRTRPGWRTEKIDARKKWVRVDSKWHYGGFVLKGTLIHRCPDCGWEIDFGK